MSTVLEIIDVEYCNRPCVVSSDKKIPVSKRKRTLFKVVFQSPDSILKNNFT